MTYKEATKAWHKVGAAHADGDGLQAMGADTLAQRLCMNPSFLYDWAQRHGVKLWQIATEMRRTEVMTKGMDIVEAALSDKPYSWKDGE